MLYYSQKRSRLSTNPINSPAISLYSVHLLDRKFCLLCERYFVSLKGMSELIIDAETFVFLH